MQELVSFMKIICKVTITKGDYKEATKEFVERVMKEKQYDKKRKTTS